MNKKLLLTSAFMPVAVISTSALTISCKNDEKVDNKNVFYYRKDDKAGACYLDGYNRVIYDEDGKLIINKEIKIPATVENTRVLGIDPNVFNYDTFIEKLIIPRTVQFIGDGAFQGCKNLKEVIFEENSELITIGKKAFAGCTSLTKITLPKNVRTISDLAFFNASSENFKLVVTTEGNMNIGANAFSGVSDKFTIEFTKISKNNINFSGENNPTSEQWKNGLQPNQIIFKN
ncbi:leucine-rich repeat domain-containing protein [Mycoplasmopsis adleri]|uniref:leucine-rich repeat domain-containing protein n=1 Tax=Mycoplasmopsis adleri TaxID=51362 RepID=UPI00387368E4